MGENFGPSYFAIITGPLLDNRALAANAKLLYASITSLTDSRGYLKSIKRGKVYQYNGAQAVRVYSTAPHAHLIEDGHRMVTHDGREVGFVPGHHVFEIAGTEFEAQYLTDVDDFLDREVGNL